MSTLHQAWETIPIEGDLQLITADEVRSLSGREPRLMMKFDHSHTLPKALEGRYILPLKNGLYAIIRGQGYHRPEPCGPVSEFCKQTTFDLVTTNTGISEMQHLDIAFNTGLLAHFLDEKLLYPTVRGRKRSPQFTFQASGHDLEVSGVQVEIDGGFEGRNTLTLVEAKIGDSEDFHLRQIYYPVRFWATQTKKRIRPVFFTYQPDTEIYRFREYRFSPLEVYQAPILVKAAAYRITEAPEGSFRPVISERDCPFPQADRLDKVAIIPFLVAEGLTSAEEISGVFEFSTRQGRYYLDACRSLGFIDKEGDLTASGQEYIHCSPTIRYRLLCRTVLKLPVMQELLANLLLAHRGKLQKHEVAMVVQEATSLGAKTAARRSQTVWSWLLWVCRYTPALSIDGETLQIHLPPCTPTEALEQLDLFG